MNFFKSGALAGAFIFTAIGFSSAVTASPVGGASRDLGVVAGETDLVVQVQGGQKKNKGNVQNNNGGNRGGGNGTRNAVAVGAGVALIGGLIAADQARRSNENEERYYDERPRCRYGSYINRYGERRCRQ